MLTVHAHCTTCTQVPARQPGSPHRRSCMVAAQVNRSLPQGRSLDFNPVGFVMQGLASNIFKAAGAVAPQDLQGLSPLWQGMKRMDHASIRAAVGAGANLNERDPRTGDTPLLFAAREG